jgi:transcriptional regulator with XRE-family HTH domain
VDEIRHEVRHEVRRRRNELGLTQRQLAKRAEITQTTLALIETGKRSPTVETLRKLAEGLGVEIADFFPKREPSLFDAPGQWGRSNVALGTLPGPVPEQGEPSEAGRQTVRLSDTKPIAKPSPTTEGTPSDATPRYSLGLLSDTEPYFKKVERGEMTAEEAVRELEREYMTR